MNLHRRQLAREITQHLQSSLDTDIDFVYEWLTLEGYDSDIDATELVMNFSQNNELPSKVARL